MQGDVGDDAAVAAALGGADAGGYSVGVLVPAGKQSFDSLHVDGAGRVARLAGAAGIGRFVHISAIGADADSDSAYARTKAEGESA
ncbi:MAG: complex I NDUFA9 subunit family protein, partial [Rhodobacteraceae bacterium]|nr:complex I NDUFA9 subunit family protein [Paracoccaceae bacterium]